MKEKIIIEIWTRRNGFYSTYERSPGGGSPPPAAWASTPKGCHWK